MSPDSLARLADARGRKELLNVVIEVTGLRMEDRTAKVAAARNLWVPAVNSRCRLGR